MKSFQSSQRSAFDDSAFLPIHYTAKPGDKSDDLPGAILRRCEGDATVLIPIDPLGNGENSKEVVTTCTKGWKRGGINSLVNIAQR